MRWEFAGRRCGEFRGEFGGKSGSTTAAASGASGASGGGGSGGVPDICSPVANGELTFMLSSNGVLTCCDMKTGHAV